ncbi:MAG: 2'-5' RNA ligase family protein [Nitrososphaera sp.]
MQRHRMPGRSRYSVCIIPPPETFPHIRIYSDRLALISPIISIAEMPHIALTGIEIATDDPGIAGWLSALKMAMADFKSFKLELGKQIRMSGGRLPDNFSLSVPTSSDLLQLTERVIDVTHSHFPKLEKKSLWSLTDHVCLVEHIPDQYRFQVAREAEKLWKPLSFQVDRVWIVKKEGNQNTMQPIDFPNRVPDGRLHGLIPDDYKTRWLFANVFAHQGTMDKITMQKLLFLVCYEGGGGRTIWNFQAYLYGPYSWELQNAADAATASGLAGWHNDTFFLTELGANVAAMCYTDLDDQDRASIAWCMKKHGDKTTAQLLNYVHGEYPDWHRDERNYPDD